MTAAPDTPKASPRDEALFATIRKAFRQPEGFIPLHAPIFAGHERDYVLDTVDSTFVSSVGAYVTRFEDMLKDLTGAAEAVAVVNGTAALHVALMLAGVQPGDIVVTQAASFVATANAIVHAGAMPAFVDVERESLGMCPDALKDFFDTQCALEDGTTVHLETGRRVAAVVPMHTFGHPCRIREIVELCDRHSILVVEDAAESLGSTVEGRHTGTFGFAGTLSFNGNKIATCGGGGAMLFMDEEAGQLARHLTTTAKLPHRWEYEHDMVAFNYRLPNINAALGCGQLEMLADFVADKRALAALYAEALNGSDRLFVQEPRGTRSNYWLCSMLLPSREERDDFLLRSNDAGIMTRPLWKPLNTLPMYEVCPAGPLDVTRDIGARLVNLPSSVRSGFAREHFDRLLAQDGAGQDAECAQQNDSAQTGVSAQKDGEAAAAAVNTVDTSSAGGSA